MKALLVIVLCCLSYSASALELFGVELESTGRDQLRAAVKNAGVTLIQEGGDNSAFDVYDSSGVMQGSDRLYLGFVDENQAFAYAEYQFPGLDSRSLVARLSAKYGPAEVSKGQYLTDRSYRWQRDGIDIQLSTQWRNYRVLLSYVHPQNLLLLRREMSASSPQAPSAPAFSTY